MNFHRSNSIAEAYGSASKRDAAMRVSGMTRNERFVRSERDRKRYYGKDESDGEVKRKTDADVLRENFEFLREDDDVPLAEMSYEEKLARKHYDRMFKEYAIANLSRYRVGLLGLRWCTEEEVRTGKGAQVCGEERCGRSNGLLTFEVPFSYEEKGIKKTTLVKLSLCSEHSRRLRKVDNLLADKVNSYLFELKAQRLTIAKIPQVLKSEKNRTEQSKRRKKEEPNNSPVGK
eukprot:CAMPEP_0184754328 /NCGR_PEP_ID=MMETSP0315-20130426/44567_1 /TAXON_ID=101924 /ORGANISM="Rhodosorus marinus, Strain UTEX LB 2760" /LENGTH=231 /DNA_ID=CAMNT_0027233745 /DNA_START=424 /DNA_END=1120 /DNA_ORIENTATION=+